jgi:ABC-2 type transport system permease protein
MAFVFRSPAFFVLMAIGIFNAWAGGCGSPAEWYGTEVLAGTRLMVQALQGAFSVIPIIIAVFYAGELVWRDREQRMHEIVDATVAPDWVHLLPKIAAIVGSCWRATGAGRRHRHGGAGWPRAGRPFEPGTTWLWFCCRRRWCGAAGRAGGVRADPGAAQDDRLGGDAGLGGGHAGAWRRWASSTTCTSTPAAPGATVGHERPGPLLGGAAWFQAYWAPFAWCWWCWPGPVRRRGAPIALRGRLMRMPQRLRGPAGLWLAPAAWPGWAWAAGSSTTPTVLNHYQTRPERDALLGRYEKALLPFESCRSRPSPT